MPPLHPTSMRFTDAERDLIAVHQTRLKERTGRDHTPTDVVRYLLGTVAPKPGATGPHEPEFRRAYAAVFGADQ